VKTLEDLEQEADIKVPEELEILLPLVHLKETLEDQMVQDPLTLVNSLQEAEAELVAEDPHLQVEDMELTLVPADQEQQHICQDRLLYTQVAEAVELLINLQTREDLEVQEEEAKEAVLVHLFL
jgi:hypothetical protein